MRVSKVPWNITPNVGDYYFLRRVSGGILSQGMLSCQFRVYLCLKEFGRIQQGRLRRDS